MYKSVDEYLAKQSVEHRGVLAQVRATIRKAVPAATEGIAYQMPGYKLNGKPLIYFAGWKEHFAIYPAGPGVLDVMKKELAGYDVSKGTIKMPWEKPPLALIAKIAKLRAKLVPPVVKKAAKKPAKRSVVRGRK